MNKTTMLAPILCVMAPIVGQGFTNEIDALDALPPLQQVQVVERIWTTNPVAYFKTVTETFKNRVKMDASFESKQAVWTAFTNAIYHPIPTNKPTLALASLGAKMSILQIYTGVPLHERWHVKAHLLGEIRSLRTYDPFEHPLYNHWAGLPDQLPHRTDLTNESMRAAFLEKATRNQTNWDSDQFQRELISQDRGLLFSLIHSVPTCRGKVPDYTNYVNQITVAAHLTDDKQRLLLGIEKPEPRSR